jgi:hypothetical protein
MQGAIETNDPWFCLIQVPARPENQDARPAFSYSDHMSTPAAEIDWDEAERRERRRDVLFAPGLMVFLIGLVLLSGRFAFLTGGAAWAVVGALLAFFLLMVVAAHLVPRLRTRSAPAYRIQAALRQHADPGPELRCRADQQARYLAGTGRLGWLFMLGPLGVLLGADWDRPIAAALVVGAASAWGLWWRRRLDAARRWVADPPGPSREAPPLSTRMRWLTGRRGVLIVVGTTLVVVLIAGLAAAVLTRS